jgi:hypothetical protein
MVVMGLELEWVAVAMGESPGRENNRTRAILFFAE